MKPKDACPPAKPLKKMLWSWLGAFMGIYAIAKIGEILQGLHHEDRVFLIGSFGASAVLTYGAPLAEFSQPRNLILGHVVSAFVGVTAYRLLPHADQMALASAIAVSFAIFLMHMFRCLHPPGGATALIGVIGSERVHGLGYGYVVYPVLAASLVLLVVALVVNNLSRNPRRHYPVYWY